jgi:anion transporter
MASRTQTLNTPAALRVAGLRLLPQYKTILPLALALIVGWAIWHMPAPYPLDEKGTQFLATLTAAVILWAFQLFDDYLVGLMLLLSWLVLNVVSSEIALSGFSKSSWFFAVGALGIGAAVNKSGVLHRIAMKSLRYLRPNCQLYNCIFAAFGLLITPLVPDVKARIVLVIPLARAISEKIGFRSASNGAAGMTLSAYSGASQMTFMFLTGSTYCLIGWSVLPESAKLEFDWLMWLLASLPSGIVFLAFLLISIFFFFPLSQAEKTKIVPQIGTEPSQAADQCLGRGEWLTLAILSIILLGWVSKPLHAIGEPWIAFGGLLAFAATGTLDKKTLTNNVDWPVILFFGVVYGMGGICTHLKIDLWLANLLQPVFAVFSFHPLPFLIASLIVVYFIRFFLAKPPAVILAMLLFLPASSELGIHPGVLLITIISGVETWILPYQNPSYLLTYSSTEGKAFTHAQGRKLMLAKFVASFIAVAISVPYWKMLGLIQ